MIFLWHLYWPAIAAALVIGIVTGRYAYRRPDPDAPNPRRNRSLGFGLLAMLAAVVLWHWPLGAVARYASEVEAGARAELKHQEMISVQARLERGPLRRSLLLSGAADDFQRSELVRIMGSVPGVSSAHWTSPPLGRSRWIPLIAEVAMLALIPFALGLLLSCLNEIRRRSNAEWSW
ncbi:MAG: hypothetical protein ABIQ32_14035 [Sphingomicrobium sp.]